MTYANAKRDAQAAATQSGLPILLYFSPVERDDHEPEAESWAYAPAAAVTRGTVGRYRETAKDETIIPRV